MVVHWGTILKWIEYFSDRVSPTGFVYGWAYRIYEYVIGSFIDDAQDWAFLAAYLSVDAYNWIVAVAALSPYV